MLYNRHTMRGGKAHAESETVNVVLIKEMILSNFHAFKKEKSRKGRTSPMRGRP